jgi:hypothetical protein
MFLGLLLHMAMSVWVFVSHGLFMAVAFNTTYISLLSKAALPSWVPLCYSAEIVSRLRTVVTVADLNCSPAQGSQLYGL